MVMKELGKNKKYGLIGTIAFHVILLLILLTSMSKPEPGFPFPQDLVVDFGNSETGVGATEPEAAKTPTPQPETREETSPPEPVEPTPSPEVTEEIVTQDDASEIAAKEQRKKEEARIKEIERKKKQEELRKQQEIDRKRKAKEAAERAEAARKAKIKADADNRAKSIFGPGGSSSNEGNTAGSGNMGKTDGVVGAKNYGENGLGQNGVSFNLEGRSATKTLTPPKIQKNVDGVVVVQITVDRDGNVLKAIPGVKGSTTLDHDLQEAARRAALKAKFNIKSNAPVQQTGTITYKFELQ